MVLGRVVGKAVSTAKHASLKGARLLVVEPIRAASLDPVLALDELGAGAGAVVILSNDGKHARRMVNDGTSPARWWVMGIVDEAGSVQERTNA
ncbi:MAG: ethanolamine utilization protein EutN [Phycisphaerae bacterium]|jgi:microcompartment protein CcmK/EutM